MLQKFKGSKWGCASIYLFIFTFMLILNVLTPLLADDFSYATNFATWKLMEGFDEIFPSLEVHAQIYNGRLISHFFVHLFMLFPQFVFDLVNALMFTLYIFLISHIANVKKQRNNYLVALVFIFTLLCHSAFGGEFLWLAGSINYLWGMVAGLVFLLPYHNYLVFDRVMHPLLWIFFIPFGFIAGAYLENVSAGVIFTAVLYIFISKLYFKKRLRPELLLAIIPSVLGYIFMATRPGTALNKLSSFDILGLLTVALYIIGMIAALALPICLYIQLFIKGKRQGLDKRIFASSLIIMAGGLASNGVMIFAEHYPIRCSIGISTSVICAAAMLYSCVGRINFGKHARIIISSFVCLFVLFVGVGIGDIIYTRVQFDENVEHIEECKARGELDVSVSKIECFTKYSAARGLDHLSKNPKDWPNSAIKRYFKLNSIKLGD